MKMNKFLVYLLVVCTQGALGLELLKDGLRVKWGRTGVNEDIFIDIPRLLEDTIAEGWEQHTQAEDAALPSLSIYCPKDGVTFCTLFDDTGIIAGLQIAYKESLIPNRPVEPATIAFIPWTVNGELYWVHQQLFVSQDTLNLSAEERKTQRESSTDILQEGAFWLRDLDGSLLKVSTDGTKLEGSIFKKQACIVTMGLHYFYNITPEVDCSVLYPWFTLLEEDNLIGSGLVFFSDYQKPSSDKRMWFETSVRAAVETTVPNGPECLYDLVSSPGLTTLHIFYGKHPLNIVC